MRLYDYFFQFSVVYRKATLRWYVPFFCFKIELINRIRRCRQNPKELGSFFILFHPVVRNSPSAIHDIRYTSARSYCLVIKSLTRRHRMLFRWSNREIIVCTVATLVVANVANWPVKADLALEHSLAPCLVIFLRAICLDKCGALCINPQLELILPTFLSLQKKNIPCVLSPNNYIHFAQLWPLFSRLLLN